MATRYDKSSQMGEKAINFIRAICTDSGKAIYRNVQEKDIGIDAYIELLNEFGETTGSLALIQSKGGLSFITKTGRYQIKAKKKHFETWSRYKNPVIGIVYNPTLHNARWVSITEHLQSHPNCIPKGPYIIDAPANQTFSLEGFTKFQSYVTAHHDQFGNDSAQLLIEQYFSGDIIKKFDCLFRLFSTYRWTPLSCFFFHQALRIEEEVSILNELTYIISYYRPFLYRLSGTMPDDNNILKDLAQKCIAGFGKAEVLKMISTIDNENGLLGKSGIIVGEHLGLFYFQYC